MDDGEYTTERGFSGYAKIIDTYGVTVRVQQSSSVEDRLFIFVDGGLAGPNNGFTHLNVEQATIVRDAIDEWIQWVKDNPLLTQEEAEIYLAEQRAAQEGQ